MVLLPKQWKSRSSPGIEAGAHPFTMSNTPSAQKGDTGVAGWSSPVARQAHNLKVTGSNPVPATNNYATAPSHPRRGRRAFYATQRAPPHGRRQSPWDTTRQIRDIARATATQAGIVRRRFGPCLLPAVTPIRRYTSVRPGHATPAATDRTTTAPCHRLSRRPEPA